MNYPNQHSRNMWKRIEAREEALKLARAQQRGERINLWLFWCGVMLLMLAGLAWAMGT